ncbi:MAG: metallophosphoesterase [Candidatus Zixiibacteriota bacterium]
MVWHNDSSATVFYLCADTIVSRDFSITDTLRFAGFCGDTESHYAVPKRIAGSRNAVYHDVPRIIAFSDLHGEYEAFVDALTAFGVVSDDQRWNWGDGHLVIVGDVFDRGPNVTECLWLIYRLEQEAASQGGRVHALLGNHETMVLRGDLRYVNEKYTDGICRNARIPYDDLYGPHTEIGRWLRTKPTAIVINGILFTHAGIPPRILDASLTLSQLNDSVRTYLDMSPVQTRFSDWPKYLYSGDGPLWYRGYFEEREGRYPLASQADVDRTLALYNADAIVVGHTEAEHITPLYNGKVIAIDVPVDELGGFEALLWEDGELYRVMRDGSRVRLR